MGIICIQEIKNFWGDALKRISSERIGEYALSPMNKSILFEVGLPIVDDLVTFYKESGIKECYYGQDRFLIIGDDYGTQIGVSLNADTKNEIYSFDVGNELPKRFINSDISKLLQLLLKYKKFKSSIVDCSDEEVALVISKLKVEFIKIDNKALADEENWWSVLLEQHEEGIM
jgi:hypothetical protein